jgi:DHA1 family tetracycline resistance protein-like MFS transporter
MTPLAHREVAAPDPRRAALAFVLVTITIDTLAFGIIIPVLPHLIQQFVGGDVATASRWAGSFSMVFALTQFICSPIQGALSDRFGRRPVILLSCLGLGLDFLLMGCAQTLQLLLVGRILSGMTAASFSTSNAYLADVTPPEKRGAAFGMLGAASGIGFVLGPALGSVLSSLHARAPFWGAALLALCNFSYGAVVLPESLPKERRRASFDWSTATAFGAVRNLSRYPQVVGLALVALLFNVAHYVLPATFVLYAEHRYGWGAKDVGYVLATMGACIALVQATISRRVIALYGERSALLAGSAFGVAGFAIYGLASTGTLFLCAIPVMALWGLASPATQALMSRQVDSKEQGLLQGAISSLTSLAGIGAPLMFAHVFASAIEMRRAFQLPGAGFLLASGLVMVAGIVGWKTTERR